MQGQLTKSHPSSRSKGIDYLLMESGKVLEEHVGREMWSFLENIICHRRAG